MHSPLFVFHSCGGVGVGLLYWFLASLEVEGFAWASDFALVEGVGRLATASEG